MNMNKIGRALLGNSQQFKLRAKKRLAFKHDDDTYERKYLREDAQYTALTNMSMHFKGIRRDALLYLSRLAMTKRGQKLIVQYLKSIYLERDDAIRAWASACHHKPRRSGKKC